MSLTFSTALLERTKNATDIQPTDSRKMSAAKFAGGSAAKACILGLAAVEVATSMAMGMVSSNPHWSAKADEASEAFGNSAEAMNKPFASTTIKGGWFSKPKTIEGPTVAAYVRTGYDAIMAKANEARDMARKNPGKVAAAAAIGAALVTFYFFGMPGGAQIAAENSGEAAGKAAENLVKQASDSATTAAQEATSTFDPKATALVPFTKATTAAQEATSTFDPNTVALVPFTKATNAMPATTPIDSKGVVELTGLPKIDPLTLIRPNPNSALAHAIRMTGMPQGPVPAPAPIPVTPTLVDNNPLGIQLGTQTLASTNWTADALVPAVNSEKPSFNFTMPNFNISGKAADLMTSVRSFFSSSTVAPVSLVARNVSNEAPAVVEPSRLKPSSFLLAIPTLLAIAGIMDCCRGGRRAAAPADAPVAAAAAPVVDRFGLIPADRAAVEAGILRKDGFPALERQYNLNAGDARQIREEMIRARNGQKSFNAIAREFGVNRETVARIINGR